MQSEEQTTQEQKIRDQALTMFFAACGYTPSHEISEFLKKDEDSFPKE